MLIKRHKLKTIIGNGSAAPSNAAEELMEAQAIELDVGNVHEQPVQEQLVIPPEMIPQEEIDAEVERRIQQLVQEKEAELVANEKKAEEEIKKVIAEAEEKASSVIEAAEQKRMEAEEFIADENARLETEKAELETLAQAEKERGYQEGFAEGETLTNDFKNILATFNTAHMELLKNAQEEVAGIALDVAKQILDREAKQSKKVLQEQIEIAIKKAVRGKGKVQVKINPEDEAIAEKIKPALSKTLDDGVELIFDTDETVDQGSCTIQTKGGKLDASFTTQLNTIKTSFEEYLGHKIEELPELEVEEEPKKTTKKSSSTQAKTPKKADKSASKTAKTGKTKAKDPPEAKGVPPSRKKEQEVSKKDIIDDKEKIKTEDLIAMFNKDEGQIEEDIIFDDELAMDMDLAEAKAKNKEIEEDEHGLDDDEYERDILDVEDPYAADASSANKERDEESGLHQNIDDYIAQEEGDHEGGFDPNY